MKNGVLVDILEKVKVIMHENPREALKIIKSFGTKVISLYDLFTLTMTKADVFYYNYKFSRAIRYYKKALHIGTRDNKDVARCYSRLGDCYWEKHRWKLAIDNYKKALIFKENIDRITLGEIYLGLASTYIDMYKYEEALRYYIEIMNLYENNYETGFEKQLYEYALSSIASCYWKLGDHEKSEEYFQKVISLPAVSSWILATAYTHKAHRLFEKSQWLEALDYYNKAIVLTDFKKDKKILGKYAKMCRKYGKRNSKGGAIRDKTKTPP